MNRVDLFLKSNRWFSKLLTGIRAVHTGFWLGLLDRQALQGLTTRQYEDDDSYAEENYNLSGLHHWETSVVEQYFSGCRTLLIGAAGAGREIIALSRRGFQADGFDCSPRFLERGRSLCEPQVWPQAFFSLRPARRRRKQGFTTA
jgi:hypothetical protein